MKVMCAESSERCSLSFGVSVQISKYVEREIINHKRLCQPHIIELREVHRLSRRVQDLGSSKFLPLNVLLGQVFLTPDYLAIAMEYAAGGDMFQLVVRQRGLLEQDARWYFQQLIIAIDYCHKMVRKTFSSWHCYSLGTHLTKGPSSLIQPRNCMMSGGFSMLPCFSRGHRLAGPRHQTPCLRCRALLTGTSSWRTHCLTAQPGLSSRSATLATPRYLNSPSQ